MQTDNRLDDIIHDLGNLMVQAHLQADHVVKIGVRSVGTAEVAEFSSPTNQGYLFASLVCHQEQYRLYDRSVQAGDLESRQGARILGASEAADALFQTICKKREEELGEHWRSAIPWNAALAKITKVARAQFRNPDQLYRAVSPSDQPVQRTVWEKDGHESIVTVFESAVTGRALLSLSMGVNRAALEQNNPCVPELIDMRIFSGDDFNDGAKEIYNSHDTVQAAYVLKDHLRQAIEAENISCVQAQKNPPMSRDEYSKLCMELALQNRQKTLEL